MPKLLDPIQLGDINCPNRVLMAPLTRARGTRDNVPTDLMTTYYAQRASAGLIISEAIGISQEGLGWPFATGLWRADQVEGWRRITGAVHDAGGRIVAQIWHMGRVTHPSFNNGIAPVSASVTKAPGRAHTYNGRDAHVAARALNVDEIPRLVADHQRAARNAITAGFDGVQIHAANGYLIDQFLRNHSNFRTDEYGGPIMNRIRFLAEITAAVIDEIGAERTSIRLSPNGNSLGVNDDDPVPLFMAVAAMLDKLDIAFLEIRESPRDGTMWQADHDPIAPIIRQHFGGPLVLNSDLNAVSAQSLLDTGQADAISFGRDFISNPDLPHRIANGIALSSYDKSKFYGQTADGYTNYPPAS